MGSFFFMITKFIALLLCAVFGADYAHASALTIDESEIDFGEKYQFAHVIHEFKAWNGSSSSTIVFQPIDKADGVSVEITPSVLRPLQVATIKVDLNVSNHVGYLGKRVRILTVEDGKQQIYSLLFMGYIDSILDSSETGVDFGVVEFNAPTERVVSIPSSRSPGFKITNVLSTPDFLDATILPGSDKIRIQTKKPSFLGYHKGVVKVALNSPDQSEAWVDVLVNFRGNIVPDRDPVSFGMQRPSSLHAVRLQLRSRNDTAFSIDHFEVDPSADVSINAVGCLPKALPTCRAFELTPDPGRPQGQIEGQATFKFAGSNEDLHVLLQGIFLNDSTKLHSLEELSSQQASVMKKPDIGSELSQATKSDSDDGPPGSGPLLKWKIANESAIYGYAIYRGDEADGTFARINENMVRAKNKGDNEEILYQYRDTTAVAHREYWYYITIFYNNGKKVQLTGPQKVLAK